MQLNEIKSLDGQYFLPVFGERTPVAFTHGSGMKLWDTDGKEYLDFLAGIAVTGLGHSHPAVTEAIVSQAQSFLHCSNIYYVESQAILAKKLIDAASDTGLKKVFFSNSGAEANEGAFKLARKYFYRQGINKYEIISANNSFHGRTLATVAATGQPKYQKPYRPLTPGFINVDFNSIDAIKEAITENTAAILLETIQGEGGIIVADNSYLQAVQALCRENGILLILDEIQTGMGRTGSLYSFTQFDLKPDIITLAKALGNGVPIGAILATEEVASKLDVGDHGSTFGGNPLATAAGNAVVDVMTSSGFMENVANIGSYFKNALSNLKSKYSFITDLRGMGLMLGLELASNIDGKKIVASMLIKGFLINCAGHNTLRFVPPLIVTYVDIDLMITALDESLGEVL